jgi:hypothetical protein
MVPWIFPETACLPGTVIRTQTVVPVLYNVVVTAGCQVGVGVRPVQ